MARTSVWLVAAALAFVSTPPPAGAEQPALDVKAWTNDLIALRNALTERYANLEWAVERGMDLPAVERRARARIQAATTEYEARMALERFVRSFGDGHLELTWPRGPMVGPESQSPQGVCDRLGYSNPADDFPVGPRMPRYVPLDRNAPALGGTFEAGGKKVAVLRIERFAPVGIECSQALRELRIQPEGPCGDACRNRVSDRADKLFVTNFEDRLRRIAATKSDVLLVDLSRNGGGNDSAIALARMLGGDLPSPKVARVRGERLAANLADKRRELGKALAGASASNWKLIFDLERQLAAAEAEARKPCDRSGLWRGERVACSASVRGPFHAGGLVARPLADPIPGDAGEILYAAGRYAYRPGLWQGPLAIIVDGDTASSAELFTAMLQDAGRAIVVGAPTAGAGCGWMLPMAPITLPHSKGEIVMPDCSRYRADGRNEVDGITPDVAAGIRPFDTPKQRAQRIAGVLAEVIRRSAFTR